MSEIRILTLWQPWASLIAMNLKQYETRSWGTIYRGKLAIHAARRPINRDEILPILYATGGGGVDMQLLDRLDQTLNQDLPLGAIVAIADLADCRQMVPNFAYPRDTAIHRESRFSIAAQTPLEKSVGDWQIGRYAWKLENVRPIGRPIPYKGGQGLRTIQDSETLERIAQQMARTEQDQSLARNLQLPLFSDRNA